MNESSLISYQSLIERNSAQELVSRLRDAELPSSVVPLSSERKPFARLSDDTILGYLDFFTRYPEALGRLSQAVKVAFGIKTPCPLEYTIKESHFDLNSLEPDILDHFIPLGFEPGDCPVSS